MALPTTIFRSWFKWRGNAQKKSPLTCTEFKEKQKRTWQSLADILFAYIILLRSEWLRHTVYLPMTDAGDPMPQHSDFVCVCVCVCVRTCVTRMGKLPCSAELTLEEGGVALLQSHTREIVTIWQVEKIKTCRTRHLKYPCWKYKQLGGCKCGLKKISVFVEENFLMLFKKTERKTEKKERKGESQVIQV